MTSNSDNNYTTPHIDIQNIKAVIFDLDGTLYKMNWSLKPLITIFLFPNIFHLPKYMKIRESMSGQDLDSGERLLDKMSELLSGQISGSDPIKIKNWIITSFYPAFIRTLYLTHKSRPGLTELLKQLKSKKIKTAVLSDFAMIKERLSSLGIPASLFDTISSSESRGALKPSTRPFIEISRELSVDPANMLVIGDRDDTDGMAARSCGMHFLQISDSCCGCKDLYSWESLRKILLTMQVGKEN